MSSTTVTTDLLLTVTEFHKAVKDGDEEKVKKYESDPRSTPTLQMHSCASAGKASLLRAPCAVKY